MQQTSGSSFCCCGEEAAVEEVVVVVCLLMVYIDWTVPRNGSWAIVSVHNVDQDRVLVLVFCVVG